MKRPKEPTWTSLVVAALRSNYNDFMSVAMLRAATGGNTHQVGAALHHLRHARVVDVVVETDGRGWWYALPPESDARSYVRNERTPENKPRKPRKSRARCHKTCLGVSGITRCTLKVDHEGECRSDA